MKTKYQNKDIVVSPADRMIASDSERVYFFPKANPPVSISAKSQEEAESKLKAFIGNKE